MWKPVPQLTNTWLQWGKSVFPAISCELFHPFILSYLHFPPPSFSVFPLLNASFIFLLCSGIFCTLDSIFPGCPSSYPSSFLNPWKRKFLYFPGSLEDLTVLPQNKDALCISPVCCIVLFNLLFFSSCHHAVLFVCLFSIRFDLFTVAGRAWKDRNTYVSELWDNLLTCYLETFSELTLFAGPGWGHCPYHDCPKK